VNFLKAPRPLRILANPLICEWVKVSMPAILAASEDDAGNFSICTLIEKSMSRREPQIAEAQLSFQADAARRITNTLLATQHVPYNSECKANIQFLNLDIVHAPLSFLAQSGPPG
jgi:hypothetical protein